MNDIGEGVGEMTEGSDEDMEFIEKVVQALCDQAGEVISQAFHQHGYDAGILLEFVEPIDTTAEVEMHLAKVQFCSMKHFLEGKAPDTMKEALRTAQEDNGIPLFISMNGRVCIRSVTSDSLDRRITSAGGTA